MANFWTADGYPGWSADGYPGWSADGAIGGVIGTGAGTIASPVGSGTALVFPVNVLAGGRARHPPIEGTAAARVLTLRGAGAGRVEDPLPIPVVGTGHGSIEPLQARAKVRHGVRGAARGISPSVQGHALMGHGVQGAAISSIRPVAARGRARQQAGLGMELHMAQQDEMLVLMLANSL
jgi:hypothetical protein